jgi:basic membrane protein A
LFDYEENNLPKMGIFLEEEEKMKKYLLIFAAMLISVSLFAAPLKVAFLYVGPVGDDGWTYSQNLGRLYVQKYFGDKIQTTYIESVSMTDAVNVLQTLAQSGYKLIYTTSFDYMEQTAQVAKLFPDVIFENCSGYLTSPNMSSYFGRIYEPEFLTGLVAGAMTKTDKIGYVAAFPTPEVVRGINAFALGVKMVNTHATVQVVWVNDWYNPPTEKEAALSLIGAGCDVIKSETDSPAPLEAAGSKGVYCIGYNTDQSSYAPKTFLTASVFNWGIYYKNDIQNVLDGTWKPQNFWGGLDTGVVDIAPMSDLVPPQVQKLVNAMEEAMKDHTFNPFAGPIYDQSGKLIVPAGQSASDQDLLSMNWFVKGVIGNIPK